MTPQIEQFLKQLLIDAGQTDLGPELEKQLVADLYTRLEDRLILTAMSNLSEEKQEELEKIVEESPDANQKSVQVENFLKTNISDYDQIFAASLEDFRNIYIEASKE